MRCRRPNWPGCSQSSACIRRWGVAGNRGWRGRSMLFKPDENNNANTADGRKPSLVSRILKRMVSLTVLCVILAGLAYIGWYAFQPKAGGGAGRGGPGARLDLPVPVLAATPRTQDVPVY